MENIYVRPNSHNVTYNVLFWGRTLKFITPLGCGLSMEKNVPPLLTCCLGPKEHMKLYIFSKTNKLQMVCQLVFQNDVKFDFFSRLHFPIF